MPRRPVLYPAEYAHYKSLLFQKCCFGIGNIDDPYYREIFKDASCQVCTYSCRQKADVQASDIMLVNRNGQLGTFFKVNGEEYAVSAPGEFSVYNAVAASRISRIINVVDVFPFVPVIPITFNSFDG